MSPKRNLTLGNSIGKNIRLLRQKKYPDRGSQTKCAADFGIRPAEWSKWENNKRTPSDETQLRLAEFFGVSLVQLRGDLVQPTTPINPYSSLSTESIQKMKDDLACAREAIGSVLKLLDEELERRGV